MSSYVFTSESVSEGHPDKVCDYIADSILDAHLEQDKMSRVACEVLCKDRQVILAGEITSNAKVDFEVVARRAITEIGYVDSREPFHAAGVSIQKLVSQQAADIAGAVSKGSLLSLCLITSMATRRATPALASSAGTIAAMRVACRPLVVNGRLIWLLEAGPAR